MDDPRRWVLIATILGSSMVFIDGTVVNIVLPVLQLDLGANAIQLQWIVVGYTLFLSSLMLVGGSLGDHYGRRRMFDIGIVIFAASSMLCGLAPNVDFLIAARCVQGIGSALLTPGSLALIGANFDERSRGKAIGTWSSVTAVMAALGPGLGGWLAQHASWRWIFYINIPLAIAVLIISRYGVPESRDREVTHHVDWFGAFSCTAGLGTLVYGLTFSSWGWVIAGVALLAAFLWIEARSPGPLVPLGLFRAPTFSGVNALTLLLYGALSGMMFFLPFEMIQIDGYAPTAAGFSFLPFIALMFFLSPVAGGLMRTIGARTLLVGGPLLTAVGFVLIGLAAGRVSFVTAYLPGIVTIGLGMSFTVAPLTTTVMDAVSDDLMGTASGINNAVSRVAGMLAIAGLGAFMLATFTAHLQSALTAIGLPHTIVAQVMNGASALAATAAPPGVDTAISAQVHGAVVLSYIASYHIVMFVNAGLAALGGLIAGLTIAPQRTP